MAVDELMIMNEGEMLWNDCCRRHVVVNRQALDGSDDFSFKLFCS